ncbi:MAG: type II secretion system secretin GspD [Thermodesulfobacteriota bacterium]
MIMGEFSGLLGWSGVKRLLTRLLIFLLTAALTGCAGSTTVTPPAPPPDPKQVPVRVAKPPPKPPSKESLRSKVEKARRESRRDIMGPESYARVIKKIPASRRRPKKGEKVYPLDLNLKGADLVEAIRVLGDTLGINYTIDPRVKGTANVRASGKLTETDILGIMETVLLVNNATMVKVGNQFKIIPLERSAQGAMPVDRRGITPVGMSAQVVFPEQTDAKEMMKALKPLLSIGGSISEGTHNSLIIIDYPANLEKILKLVHLIDTQALTQTLVRVVRVDNTDPSEIIGELEVIFAAYGTLAKKGKFGVSFTAVPRLNAVMILADSGSLMERALYWARHLDQRTDMLANVHVYNVENYKAKNLADLLTQVYGGAAAAPTVKEKKPETGARALGRSTFGSGSGTSGTSTQSQSVSSMSSLGTSGTSGTSTLGAGAGLSAGGSLLKERAVPMGTGAQQGVSPKEGVRIIPDEENNLLVVVAPPHEWRIISRLLKSLDIMPRQVLNEVLVAEVRLSDELSYGIEFLLGGTASSTTTSTGTTTGTTSTSGVLVSSSSSTTTTAPGTIAGVDISGPASAAFTAASGFTFVATDTLNKLKGLINLLASQGKVNILASPHIMAANNQEATIMIGEEVPTLTSTSTPLVSQTTSYSTSTVQYRNTGIILSVKPQINANGMVTLEIAQEVSSAATTSTGVSGTPTFTVRQAKTSLITGDNQTVVLGGLIREDKTTSQAGIPGLRKMPILGPLFGSEKISKQKTELLVLITPHIITNMEEGARVTHEMKEKVGLEEPPPLRRETPKPPKPFYSPY